LSAMNSPGKSELLVVAEDAKWNQHGSGREKDSLSGCAVFKVTLGRTRNAIRWCLQCWNPISMTNDLCRECCKVKKERSDTKSEKLCFPCKEKNNELYLHFKKHQDESMEKESLVELHHLHDTNHVEGFSELII
jgi:hypothetical protein